MPTGASMPSIACEIVNKLGLHARAAAKLTHLASGYRSDIWVSRSGRRVNAKSIMGVMMLAAGLGASVTIDADGLEAFLNLHRMILDDSALSRAPRELIRTRRYNAEWALLQQMEKLTERFDEINDQYLRERKADIQQAVERVLKALMGGHALPEPALSQEQRLIVVAHDLSPADMILFKRHHFGGFVTDVGGVTSHTAIVARSLGIPAIVGLHHAYQTISEGELLIVDGVHGVLIVNPDPLVLEEYKSLQSQLGLERKRLKLLKSTPAATLDGTPIELYANIELPQDVAEALEA